MAFQVSPGINVSEIDLTAIVPAVSVSVGALAGVFRWGPVNERILISNEKQLAQVFGEPSSYFKDDTYQNLWQNYETFFTAANFLSYSNALYVVRTAGGARVDSEVTEDLTFTSQSTITSVNTDLSVFNAGDQIVIAGTANNDGTFKIASAPTTNAIVVEDVVIEADDLAFSGNTITSVRSRLTSLREGSEIVVSGTTSNDGTYVVVSVVSEDAVTVEAVNGDPVTFTEEGVSTGGVEGKIAGGAFVPGTNEGAIITSDATNATSANFDAKYPGELGNSIGVSFCSTDANNVSEFDKTNGAGTLFIEAFNEERKGTITNLASEAAISQVLDVGDDIVLADGNRLTVTNIGKPVPETAPTVTASDIAFSGANRTITTFGSVSLREFEVGESITISGSDSNDGTYTVTTVSETVITVAESLVNEGTGASVTITGEAPQTGSLTFDPTSTTSQTTVTGNVTFSGSVIDGGTSTDVSGFEVGETIQVSAPTEGGQTNTGSYVVASVDDAANTVTVTTTFATNYAEEVVATDLTFDSGTSTIAGGAVDFSVFEVGETITVTGSVSNNGTFTISSLTSTEIVVNEAITDEGAGDASATITGSADAVSAIITGETGDVNITTDEITITSHGLPNGAPVTYSNNGGTQIEGLNNGQTYYAIVVDANTIQLAATYPNAVAGIAINLTGVGVGDTHTLTILNRYVVDVTFDRRYADVNNYNGSYEVQWRDAGLFLAKPSPNSVHVVVRDIDGSISGQANNILEIYENVSTVPGATKVDGAINYIVDVLENESNYISTTTAKASLLVNVANSEQQTLTGGYDGDDEANIAIGDLVKGYDLFKDPEIVDISLVMQGKARNTVLGNYITNNIAETRKDCVSFVSPEVTDTTAADVVDFSSRLTGSSYMVVDSGYKYQYDKYNDVYRWIPLNGDIAGLCARTDTDRDPWFSPAGFNRGIIKNVVKLRFNPNKAERDLLYLNNVNPVISEPGSGTLLFGDKTFSPIASAFDRINVRRLFIVLEKAISGAAKALLFEFNDEFTRAQFKNLVEPFLREVQGRRGIFDFKVVCDETNNTPEVIDSNQFVGDIFIKPARSINFIQLNFVAVRTGVEFEEVVGAV